MKDRILPFIALAVLAFFLLPSCEKDGEAPKGPYLDYFPVEPGHSVTYEVDSIFHDSALEEHDTSHYLIREAITRTFVDGEGRTSYRIERSRKELASGQWRVEDVWVANRSKERAEKVEENRRFIKLSFPVSEDARWNGNAYNDLKEQDYEYKDVHEPMVVKGHSLDSTVKVVQKDVSNLIEEKFVQETYAKGIGMVEKEAVLLETYTNGDIRKGSELYMRMIDHSSP